MGRNHFEPLYKTVVGCVQDIVLEYHNQHLEEGLLGG